MKNKILNIGVIIDAKPDSSLVVIDFPDNLVGFKKNSILNIGFSEKFSHEFKIKIYKFSKNKININLEGLTEHLEAKKMIEQAVFIDESYLEFSNENGFYVSDLLGSEVYDIETENYIGKISDVLVLPANDVWMVQMIDGLLPIPVIDDVVKFVDIKAKIVKIQIIHGLMEIKE